MKDLIKISIAGLALLFIIIACAPIEKQEEIEWDYKIKVGTNEDPTFTIYDYNQKDTLFIIDEHICAFIEQR